MKKAFTMIELIFAIVIIGVLSAVALPNFFDLKFKSDLGDLKSEIEAINNKVNTKLLKNVMTGTNESYQEFDTTGSASDKIFTELFKDGLNNGSENKGWFYLGKKDKSSSVISPYMTSYNPDTDYKKYLDQELKIAGLIPDETYIIYKYSINKNIYFNFLYRSINSSFTCVKATCNSCSNSKKQTINNMIPCYEKAI